MATIENFFENNTVSTDIAYLQMDIQRLNQSIVEIEEIITGRMSDDG